MTTPNAAEARLPDAAGPVAHAASAVAPATRPVGAVELADAALDWYATNGRDLAFRRTRDPWSVLVSEVMAQQTQAARAAEAWRAFMQHYPSPAAFAATTPAEAIRTWRGLGYNRRAVALRAAAIRIVADHAGRVPDTIEALEALPGIGPYTARAVLAIAFGRPVAALDTNIRRVLDREVGGLPTSPSGLQAAADAFVPVGRAGEWTHALMDIGATICRKREPRCGACPLAARCVALRDGGPPETTTPSAELRTDTRRRTAARPRFASTNRWLRGRILDALRDTPNGVWRAFESPIGDHSTDAVLAALSGLGSEGLLELHTDLPGLARLASA